MIKNYFQLLKLLFFPFFVLLLTASHLDQLINENIEMRLRSPEGTDFKLWIFVGLSLILSLLFPWLIQTLGLQFYLKSENFSNDVKSFKKNLNFMAIESLRAWGKMVLYSLLFLLPGLWKFLQYQFIPWIVCLSRKYDQGEIDALETSQKLFKKAWGRILLLSLIFFVFIPLVLNVGFDQNQFLWVSPILSLIYHGIETLIYVLFLQIMTNLFLVLLGEENHESVLQLERH